MKTIDWIREHYEWGEDKSLCQICGGVYPNIDLVKNPYALYNSNDRVGHHFDCTLAKVLEKDGLEVAWDSFYDDKDFVEILRDEESLYVNYKGKIIRPWSVHRYLTSYKEHSYQMIIKVDDVEYRVGELDTNYWIYDCPRKVKKDKYGFFILNEKRKKVRPYTKTSFNQGDKVSFKLKADENRLFSYEIVGKDLKEFWYSWKQRRGVLDWFKCVSPTEDLLEFFPNLAHTKIKPKPFANLKKQVGLLKQGDRKTEKLKKLNKELDKMDEYIYRVAHGICVASSFSPSDYHSSLNYY